MLLFLEAPRRVFCGKGFEKSPYSRYSKVTEAAVSSEAGVEGFTKLKLENPFTHISPHPSDNLSIVYFLRRHETDLPGELGQRALITYDNCK